MPRDPRHNRQRHGAIKKLTATRKLGIIRDLTEAINLLTIEDRIHETDEFGTDIGKVLESIAMALDGLGHPAEVSNGGFGRAPTIAFTEA